MPAKKVKKNYIPKNETQQSQFLEKYPEFDGRGLKMAIIDGGIDVSLPGLQKTSTGLPKIIDCFDITGNGSIDTSIIKKLDENNSLIGLSRRELKIPLKWKNPSGEWHLGIKSLIKLCQYKYMGKDFIQKLTDLLIPKAEMAVKNLKQEGQIDLKDFEEVDCIVWNDGEKWCSALITSVDSNNLENVKVITNFRDEHDYGYLVEKITCCATISEDGNLLQIFTSSESHGTKVAHIAASHYPNNTEKNGDGLAPGAQIYFMEVKSGDLKGNFVEKALLKCAELCVNVINISLGLCEINKNVLEKIKELQNEHGTIIVYAAGNDGPLFWTTDEMKEDGMDEHFLFIGSLVASEINETNHKWNSPTTSLFSSKGPAINDCSRGVSFVAPGEAIVPTASWISETPQFVSGTSFAAPNAAGAIACLLSALKATSIPYSPALIKFALENTAIPLEDRLASGAGIIQIDCAFEFLKNFSKMDLQIPFPQIFIKGSLWRGIYEFVDNNTKSKNFCICVSTVKEEGKNIPWILKLLPESSNSYISHSKAVKNGTFDVEIMPEFLERGKLYYAEIQGCHPSPPVIGSFFHLPITLVVPEIVNSNTYQKPLNIQSNKPTYLFLDPPPNAKKCILKFTTQKRKINKKSVFKFGQRKRNIYEFQRVIEINSKNVNDNGIHEFYPKYCDISIRWGEDYFEACFLIEEKFIRTKNCLFKVKFF